MAANMYMHIHIYMFRGLRVYRGFKGYKGFKGLQGIINVYRGLEGDLNLNVSRRSLHRTTFTCTHCTSSASHKEYYNIHMKNETTRMYMYMYNVQYS